MTNRCPSAGGGLRFARVVRQQRLCRGVDRGDADQLLVHELLDAHAGELASVGASPWRARRISSNIEVGIEGLPAKRACAWADVLEVPRDAFFNFVTGQTARLDIAKANAKPEGGNRLAAAEAELLGIYRRLPPKYQRRLREQAAEFETLAKARKPTR